MLLSNRTREILLLILSARGYIEIPEIARKLHISDRTVYRELRDVGDLLSDYHLTLETASRRGVTISGRPEDMRELRHFLSEANDVLLVNPDKRADYLLLYLVHQREFVKMEAIALDHACAVSAVRSDLARIREQLDGYELELLQQKGQGVLLDGALMEKHHLMTDVLLRRVEETALYRWLDSDTGEAGPYLARIEEYGLREDLQRVHRCLRGVLRGQDSHMAELKTRNYLEMVLLLTCLLHFHGTSDQYQKHMDAGITDPDTQRLFYDVLLHIREELTDSLTENEISYVQWVIRISLTGDIRAVTTIRRQTLRDDILRFIEYVEERVGIYLTRDRELRESLYTHLDKALVRIRSNMQIENPALSEIREKHGELFRVIREGVRECFPGDYFPEDEIGYLVLYFALALDKFTKRIFRVIVVCSGGMGSSKMLAYALEREIPEIQVVKTLSVVALADENLDDYDLVLSTIPLYEDDDQYLRVSPMLRDNEIAMIREKIRRHKHGQLRRIEEEDREKEMLLARDNRPKLLRVRAASELALQMMDSLEVLSLPASAGLTRDVQEALEELGYVPGEVRVSQESAFLLPLTSCAYYEGVSGSLPHPVLLILQYAGQNPLEGFDSDFDTAAIILRGENLEGETSKALRFLIEQLIEDGRFIESIPEGRRGVRNWLGGCFAEYIAEAVKG